MSATDFYHNSLKCLYSKVAFTLYRFPTSPIGKMTDMAPASTPDAVMGQRIFYFGLGGAFLTNKEQSRAVRRQRSLNHHLLNLTSPASSLHSPKSPSPTRLYECLLGKYWPLGFERNRLISTVTIVGCFQAHNSCT